MYEKKEMCVKLVIYKNYTEMHGQQNIKKVNNCPQVITNFMQKQAMKAHRGE